MQLCIEIWSLFGKLHVVCLGKKKIKYLSRYNSLDWGITDEVFIGRFNCLISFQLRMLRKKCWSRRVCNALHERAVIATDVLLCLQENIRYMWGTCNERFVTITHTDTCIFGWRQHLSPAHTKYHFSTRGRQMKTLLIWTIIRRTTYFLSRSDFIKQYTVYIITDTRIGSQTQSVKWGQQTPQVAHTNIQTFERPTSRPSGIASWKINIAGNPNLLPIIPHSQTGTCTHVRAENTNSGLFVWPLSSIDIWITQSTDKATFAGAICLVAKCFKQMLISSHLHQTLEIITCFNAQLDQDFRSVSIWDIWYWLSSSVPLHLTGQSQVLHSLRFSGIQNFLTEKVSNPERQNTTKTSELSTL